MEKEEKKPKVNLVISCQTLGLDADTAVIDNFAIEVFPVDTDDKKTAKKLRDDISYFEEEEHLSLSGRFRIDEQLFNLGRMVENSTVCFRKTVHYPKEIKEVELDVLIKLRIFLDILDKNYDVNVWGKNAPWHAQVLCSLINDYLKWENKTFGTEYQEFRWPFSRKKTYHVGALHFFNNNFDEFDYGTDPNERDDADGIVARYRDMLEVITQGVKCVI